jgi:hypothetical protein
VVRFAKRFINHRGTENNPLVTFAKAKSSLVWALLAEQPCCAFCYRCALASSAANTTRLETPALRGFKFLHSHSSSNSRESIAAFPANGPSLAECSTTQLRTRWLYVPLSRKDRVAIVTSASPRGVVLRLAGIEPGNDLKKFSFLVRESRSRTD